MDVWWIIFIKRAPGYISKVINIMMMCMFNGRLPAGNHLMIKNKENY